MGTAALIAFAFNSVRENKMPALPIILLMNKQSSMQRTSHVLQSLKMNVSEKGKNEMSAVSFHDSQIFLGGEQIM